MRPSERIKHIVEISEEGFLGLTRANKALNEIVKILDELHAEIETLKANQHEK